MQSVAVYHERRVGRVKDLVRLGQVIDVAEEIALSEGVKAQPRFIQKQDQLVAVPLSLDSVEPHDETEEPDEAFASLADGQRNSVLLALDADVKVRPVVKGWLIRGIRADVELDVQFLILLPVFENLVRDRNRQSFEPCLNLLVALGVCEFFKAHVGQLEEAQHSLVFIGELNWIGCALRKCI